MTTWTERLLKTLMDKQVNVLATYAEEKRVLGYGRAAKVIIDGAGGGVFDLMFAETGICLKPPDVPVKNIVYLTENTLFNLVTPEVDLGELVKMVERDGIEKAAVGLHPRLSFREALANGSIRISGDKADVDSEELAQILEKVVLTLAFPVVIQGILRTTQKKK
ncbi:MAG: hypothetical protein Q7T57_04620 [Dehalococcoidales bacterium]|nr:hypothetical protein [Dehalococcoidales bacterium]